MEFRRLRHGYTNRTVGDGLVVRKTYAGPEAEQRLGRELAALTRLRDRVPLPPVRAVRGRTLELGFVAGEHGEDLIDAGHATEVLRACGAVLREIHGADQDARGRVLVHGDYGPNNLLLEEKDGALRVTAVLDWEFAHLGDPVEDLAWCEWLVRTHHPEHAGVLGAFFAAYGGPVPSWEVRHKTMLNRCLELADFCARWEPGGVGVDVWHERAVATAAWPATQPDPSTGTT